MTMENSDDIRLIVKIAQLYYEQDMTQAQIARELGIYRTTISRLLKRAASRALLPSPSTMTTMKTCGSSNSSSKKFGLKEAVVASSDGLLEEEQLSAMGQHGALLVDRLLEPGDIIGFSWGRAGAFAGGEPAAGQPLTPGDLRPHHRRAFR